MSPPLDIVVNSLHTQDLKSNGTKLQLAHNECAPSKVSILRELVHCYIIALLNTIHQAVQGSHVLMLAKIISNIVFLGHLIFFFPITSW